MDATSGARSAAHEGREPAAGSAAGAAGDPAAGLVRRGGGTILDAIGNTPLVMVDGIWSKLEYLNPSGSIKARIAKYMIERAEREGLLARGDTIVEASSGNTGNAMSMVAAVKGYRMLVVMPDGMSGERLAISRAFGAQVMTLGDFHVNDALAKVAELGRKPGYFAPQCSVLAHEPAAGRARLPRPAPGGRWHGLITAPQPTAPLIEAEGPPSGLAVSWTPPGRCGLAARGHARNPHDPSGRAPMLARIPRSVAGNGCRSMRRQRAGRRR